MTTALGAAPTVPAKERPRRITAVCATGEHGTCLGTVYLWPAPAHGPYLVRCECPVCNHVVSPTYGH